MTGVQTCALPISLGQGTVHLFAFWLIKIPDDWVPFFSSDPTLFVSEPVGVLL